MNVLITGANGGIGRSSIKYFAEKGANIYACTHKKEENFINFTQELANKYKVKIEPLFFDICDYDAVKKIIVDIHKRKENIDVLINNAGILKEALLNMTTSSEAKKMFDINFFAPFYLIQLVSKIMIKQQKGGAIVNVSSIAAFDGVEGQSIYGATKAALVAMTKSVAKELGKYNIRANCVAPGVTQTNLISNMRPKILDSEKEATYLKRLAISDDIAKTIVFLASDDASHITGQVLRVDGGKN